jgi:glycosyltransferase involved in cell wall biosynthesis
MTDCILYATADWDAACWTNKQHTAQRLAQRGVRVLYVETVGIRPPSLTCGRDLSRIVRRLKRGLRGPRLVAPNIWVLSPLVIPFKRRWGIVKGLNHFILKATIALFCLRQAFRKPLIWTYHPYMLDSLPPGRGKVVYHCVDDLTTIPGVDVDAYNAAERELLKRTDIVFTTTESLAEHCREGHPNVVNLPNVVDLEHFIQAHDDGDVPDDLAAVPQPRIAFVGVLSDFKVDFDLLLTVARARPLWHIVLIGEEREAQASAVLSEMRGLKNVHLLGHKKYQDIPRYLRGVDVALLPDLINKYTRAMFPMKYFEYLAAGTPVVSTPLAFTKTYHAGMEIADGADAFIAAIERQLARGRFTRDGSLALVGDNTWDARLDKMLALIERG